MRLRGHLLRGRGRRIIMIEYCEICGCQLHRTAGTYARPSVKGRSHATGHHYVPKRFFGHSKNRAETVAGIFKECPWNAEGKTGVFCYECHEELLHNPVLLPEDIGCFRALVECRGLSESTKPGERDKIAGRIQLLHEVIANGLEAMFAAGGKKQ